MEYFDSLAVAWKAMILPWAIESTLVALLLLAVLRLGRRLSPAFRKSLATLGLVKLALPPVALPVGLLSLGVTDPSGSSVAPLGAPLPDPLVTALAAVHLAGVGVALTLLVRRVGEIRALVSTAAPVRDERVLGSLHELASAIGLRRVPRLVVSRAAGVPFATGPWRPTIVLPAGLVADADPERLRGLLAHELIHLERGDLWLAWLRAVVVSLWWPIPPARALARLHEDAGEELCDAEVLARRLAVEDDYARGLLAVAVGGAVAGRRGPLPITAAAGASALEQRIRRLGRPSRTRLGLAASMVVGALALLLLPAASTGRSSPVGWTQRLLFIHPHDVAVPQSEPPAGARHRTAHDHRHGH